jgi:RNA polymerase sigma-70 factor (ECF subfamily)
MSQTHPDSELLGRIARGDVDAIGTLYDRHASVAMSIALRIVRDRSEAEDVLHDAFVLVGERAGQYAADRGSVSSWLLTLVRNLAIDRARRRERRGAIARQLLVHEPVDRVADPERLASDAAERTLVRCAMSALPEVQRRTIEDAFFEGMSYPEIARREGVPTGTIKSRAARAFVALRRSQLGQGRSSAATPDAPPQSSSFGR